MRHPSAPLRAALIDDEPSARHLLRQLLAQAETPVEVVGEAGTVISACQLLQQAAPDVVFLDIKLEDGTGFEVLETIQEPAFEIIFTTAFDHFAITAFQHAALDYLLKPLHPDLLRQAVNRAAHAQHGRLLPQLKYLQRIIKQPRPDRLLVSRQGGFDVVLLSDILYLQGEGNYTDFHCAAARTLTSSKPLQEYEAMLPQDQYVRIHQSYLVNLDQVRAYHGGEEGMQVTLANGETLPVARRKRQDFLSAMQGWVQA